MPNYAPALISCVLLTRVSRAASIRTIALYCSRVIILVSHENIASLPSLSPPPLSLSLSFCLRGAARFDRNKIARVIVPPRSISALRPVVSDLTPEIARAASAVYRIARDLDANRSGI